MNVKVCPNCRDYFTDGWGEFVTFDDLQAQTRGFCAATCEKQYEKDKALDENS